MKSEVNINGRRLQITLVFNALRELVFGWWTQAEKPTMARVHGGIGMRRTGNRRRRGFRDADGNRSRISSSG